MIKLHYILALLAAHFVADYVFQTTHIGLNKGKDYKVLAIHIIIYMVIMFALTTTLFSSYNLQAKFILVNGLLHWIVDAITSKLSHRYYAEGRIYAFWKVIGIDQLLHHTCLLTTFVWLAQ